MKHLVIICLVHQKLCESYRDGILKSEGLQSAYLGLRRVYVAAVSGLLYVSFSVYVGFTFGAEGVYEVFTPGLHCVSRELAVCLYRTVSHIMPVWTSQSFEFDCGRPYNTLDQYNVFEGIGMI